MIYPKRLEQCARGERRGRRKIKKKGGRETHSPRALNSSHPLTRLALSLPPSFRARLAFSFVKRMIGVNGRPRVYNLFESSWLLPIHLSSRSVSFFFVARDLLLDESATNVEQERERENEKRGEKKGSKVESYAPLRRGTRDAIVARRLHTSLTMRHRKSPEDDELTEEPAARGSWATPPRAASCSLSLSSGGDPPAT